MKKNEFVNLDQMQDMTKEEYKYFVQAENLTCVDSDGVLWSSVADYPIATNAEQLLIYINELQDELTEIKKLEYRDKRYSLGYNG